MIRDRLRVIYLLIGYIVLCTWAMPQAQTPPTGSSSVTPPTLTEPIRPEAVTARKAEIEKQLAALAESKRPAEAVEAERVALDTRLKVLQALEKAWQTREAFQANLKALPQRLQEVADERKRLEARSPRRFPQVTEQMHDDYATQVQEMQEELQRLTKETAAGDVRLAGIPADIQDRAATRQQLEKKLRVRQGQAAATDEATSDREIELMRWRLALARAETESWEAEQNWLSKRGPLQDALVGVAQVRLEALQRDLETIQQALDTSLQQEKTDLSREVARIKQQLQDATDPATTPSLRVRLETVGIQRTNATYRQQLTQIEEQVRRREEQNTHAQRQIDRVQALVEKHKSSGLVAQRLLVGFQRLQYLRLRHKDAPVEEIQGRLQGVQVEMFTTEDRLVEFENDASTRMANFTAVVETLPRQQQHIRESDFRQTLDAQRGALREQQQVLGALVQNYTTLLTLYQDYKRLLDDTYRYALSTLFWIRDARAMQWDVARDIWAGSVSNVGRMWDIALAAQTHIRTTLSRSIVFWLMVLVVLLITPWLAMWTRRRVSHRLTARLARSASEGTPARLGNTILALVHTAVWPAYLVILAWFLGQFLRQMPIQIDLAMALERGLLRGAVVLGLSLGVWALLVPQGLAQRYWALSAELCHFLRPMVLVLSMASLVFLIPRYVLLQVPGAGDAAAGSTALARACFLGFQVVLVVLIGFVGRRRSPVMEAILARSQQHSGLWWHVWPLIYLVLMGIILSIIALDILGYRYAARSIWFSAVESIFVVFLIRLLSLIVVLRVLHGLKRLVFRPGSLLQQRYEGVEEAIDRVFHFVYTACKPLLGLLALAIVLEIWGVSIFHFLSSPLGAELLTRVAISALVVGLTIMVIYLSNVLTAYALQPRTTREGDTIDPSRQAMTLAPLIQALIKVGVIFVALLVVLEQVGVATGPFLTGLGIFGLAIGLASQSLIKDVITGLFILFEDSLAVGDIVILRGVGGQVEKVTLRAVTIRDLEGVVHVMPNSTLDMISNRTKDYSRYLMDVRVPYGEDVDNVSGMLREVDEEMRQDPDYQDDMLEPIEVMGLDRFDESAVIIRARLKTLPQRQFRLGREFNRRLKKVFEARGIQMPFPHRILYWRTPPEGEQAALQQAAAGHQLQRDNEE